MIGDKLSGTELSPEDIQYLKQLFECEYTGLLSYARCVTQEDINAEDLVQDVFLIALLKIEDVRKSYSPKYWLYRTMKNLINNKRRDLQRMKNAMQKMEAETSNLNSPSNSEFDSEILLFMSCQANIKATDWKLFCDYCLNGYSYRELAARNGISESACKMRILRVKRLLAKQLTAAGLRE